MATKVVSKSKVESKPQAVESKKPEATQPAQSSCSIEAVKLQAEVGRLLERVTEQTAELEASAAKLAAFTAAIPDRVVRLQAREQVEVFLAQGRAQGHPVPPELQQVLDWLKT